MPPGKEEEMSVFTEESKKIQFGEKCNNFLMRWLKDKK